MSAPLTKMQIWGAPLALGALSLVGLVAALLADGVGDAASWVALGVPVGVSIWYSVRRSSAARGARLSTQD